MSETCLNSRKMCIECFKHPKLWYQRTRITVFNNLINRIDTIIYKKIRHELFSGQPASFDPFDNYPF